MPQTPTSGVITLKPTLLAFMPRQVLLADQVMKHRNSNASAKKAVSLDSDQKYLLFRSVAHFLKVYGFSKTLKKFLSEAQVEIDDTNDAMLDLEELYIKYLEKSDDRKNKMKGKKEQDEQVVVDKVEMLEEQPKELDRKGKEKTKNKNNITSEDETVVSVTGKKSKDANVEGKDSKECVTNKKKTMDKERKKTTKISLSDNAESRAANSTLLGHNDERLDEEEKTKCNTKKKKKDDSKDIKLISERMDDSRMSDSEDARRDNDGNKKRKRIVSDENDSKAADTRAVKKSKCTKIEGLKFTKESELQPHSDESLGSHKIDLQSNAIDQPNKLENGSAINAFMQETKKKQLNISAEPKTVKAFQRVKVDEVLFIDERLKDNSYWAKDGAETGYGAKAQEVLGQVRGRDFRHEKTKKKRGSYRGGQIDLASHSVKFNYSDDE